MLAHRQLWAKTGTDGQWHALPYHLLDVAAAAEVLWARLPAHSHASALQAFESDTGVAKLCVFLAASHDVGKANRYFQAKATRQHARLTSLGIDLPPCDFDENPRHGQATGAHLKPWLVDRWKWGTMVAETVALAVGGHHGTFFADTRTTRLGVDCQSWRDVGIALLDALAVVLEVGVPVEAKAEALNPFLGWLSGFVCVADWLGSHESMAVWQTAEMPLVDYFHDARRRATKLFDELRWQAPRATPVLRTADLLPTGAAPNALQQLAEEIARGCSIAIVEAPTGEGKTEAAFALAEPGRSAGAGVYFALPTMATANGLYNRVEAYLWRATGNDELQTRLLHSHAWLFRENAQTAENPGEEGKEQGTYAQDWFVGPKRGLLAPYAVGTIDQALVAALRAKHGFVRLFALAGKTIVIDEVHAYDVYMADLMEVLLGWLRAMRCRVILLSATLPVARRKALLVAWGAQAEPPQSEYPSITWVTEQGEVQARGFYVEPRKPLTLKLVPADGEEPWRHGAEWVLRLVRDNGGLGALVLNTVRDAQKAYDWLGCQQLAGIHLDLFHARFTARDRDAAETRVCECFGKDGPRTRPAILVATQVVEQSLDLDFDHMVSGLAPIDLLIQRAGRLHRHRRTAGGCLRDSGPDERANPVLHVLDPPTEGDGLPDIRDPVYSHDVLMRTLQRLRGRSVVTWPLDVADAIEEVYGERERAATLSAWEQKLRGLEAKTAQKASRDRKQAERATIYAVDDGDHLIVETPLDLDESDERQGSQLAARTRLEDRPSVTVALLCEEAGRRVTIHGADRGDPRGAMLACIRITPPYPLWEAFLALDPLPAWSRRGSLSQARPLVLTKGRAVLAGYDVCYDSRRGLDWRRIDGHVQA